MKNILRTILAFAAVAGLAASARAAEGGYPLDRVELRPNDLVSLQSGARTFVNYCLGCHGAQYLRYNRLTAIGLTEAQILENLMPADAKIGDPMKVSLPGRESKSWFGVTPPDLSLIARSRSADWLYTYLRTFYRDERAASGWNNAAFPNVAMPNPLWAVQGERDLKIVVEKDKSGREHTDYVWSQRTAGTLSEVEFNRTARDLVNFLAFVSEPDAQFRKRVGIVVLFVLGVVFVFAYWMKKAYWSDVH